MSRWALMGFALLLSACGVEGRVERADDALRADDLIAAEAGYRWVLEREAEHPGALYGLGWVYHLSGDPERAGEYFKRCTRVAPNDYRGYKGLGSIHMARGEIAAAEAQFALALERAPEEPSVLNSLALARISAEREAEAIELLERAIALEPERGEYGLNLAEALLRLRRFEEAREVIDGALQQRIEERRFRAMLLLMRARVLAGMTTGPLDAARCAEAAPTLLLYLEEADRNLDQAEALEIELAEMPAARRLIYRRRGAVTESCPGAEPLERW